ncbi:hypothetical protein [Neptunomonas antarctica]|uniref:Uncharacterized protein n=1 Tax=Neptunomonas antarctica TaxID=619304 RepID=A0A1N7K638_9GAMM|nr:hypothetical protein [Neptunomonas antarctica]SIS57052.1 hypothetical protein SAMN05421760_102215 [Neptunomonas antarctica]
MYRVIRLTVLLTLLVIVSLNALLSKNRSTDWNDPLWVVIYPVNADSREDTQRYINTLKTVQFDDINDFFVREARRYRLELENPVNVILAPPLVNQPPEPANNPSLVENVIWSLKMRYWSWQQDGWDGPTPDIKIYMRFYSPDNPHALRHSLGLQKGLIGLVNGYADADYQGQNNLIAVHELLHTLGATDKYDPKTNWPLWPDGYADPTKVPLLPQKKAEIMAGRVQISPAIAVIPPSLTEVVVGSATAIEIDWRAE